MRIYPEVAPWYPSDLACNIALLSFGWIMLTIAVDSNTRVALHKGEVHVDREFCARGVVPYYQIDVRVRA